MDIKNALMSGQNLFLGEIKWILFQKNAKVMISDTTKSDLSNISCQREPFTVSIFTTASCIANPSAADTAKKNVFGLAGITNTIPSSPKIYQTASRLKRWFSIYTRLRLIGVRALNLMNGLNICLRVWLWHGRGAVQGSRRRTGYWFMEIIC